MKTPQQSYPELNKILGIEVYLKREDQHKYGSHKGRSIPVMIKKYAKGEIVTHEDGSEEIINIFKKFVISSSGNSALAAIESVQAHNRNNGEPVELTVYVGMHIDNEKLKRLKTIIEDPKIKLEQTARPRQTAFQAEKNGDVKNLRQSTDDNALLGYYELADELNRIPNLQAIFIPTSSGTTAQALGEAFVNIAPSAWGGAQHPQIHIVQTTSCHPIAEVFDTPNSEEKSIAGAIVDNIAHRKEKMIDAIKNSHGSGWIVTNEEILEAQKLVKDTCNIQISTNSALSIAGLTKALKNGGKFDGVVVCVITGM
ncbi:MAG: PLP-dependent lyase/thiolase [Candidatus Magasanikbacteria bacterium]|nr:PLP-dependent lyase/thiolase [Candidatus Magasanikbacteria bacterium]